MQYVVNCFHTENSGELYARVLHLRLATLYPFPTTDAITPRHVSFFILCD